MQEVPGRLGLDCSHISGLFDEEYLSSSGPDGICASSPQQPIGLLRPREPIRF